MKKYLAYIINNHGQGQKEELIELLSMDRPRLTRRDFANIIRGMFFWAASSCVYRDMKAVICCDNRKLLTIDCRTVTDGSTIRTILSAGGRWIRTMTVAE